MASSNSIRLVSPAVDFIDNRLPEHHPSLSAVDPSTYFDHAQDRYVVTRSRHEMNLLQNAPLSEESEGVALGKVECPVSAAGNGHARTFSDTMREFIKDYPNEPEGRIDKECSIRQQISWEGVLHVLQSTGEKYLTKQGFKGKVRKAARFVGDKADVMKRVAGVIPEVDYSKPIIGALTFLLEARLGYPPSITCLELSADNLPIRHSSRRARCELKSRTACRT